MNTGTLLVFNGVLVYRNEKIHKYARYCGNCETCRNRIQGVEQCQDTRQSDNFFHIKRCWQNNRQWLPFSDACYTGVDFINTPAPQYESKYKCYKDDFHTNHVYGNTRLFNSISLTTSFFYNNIRII